MKTKTLNNSSINQAKNQVRDIEVFGDGDLFKLVSKASSKEEGWMKSTKAMEIDGCGVVVQVTTQQRNEDGSYAVAEALTFVPGACITGDRDKRKIEDVDQVVYRKAVKLDNEEIEKRKEELKKQRF